MAIKTVADLKKELHKNGIKTYRNKKTQASYVKRSDVKKFLSTATYSLTLYRQSDDSEVGGGGFSVDTIEDVARKIKEELGDKATSSGTGDVYYDADGSLYMSIDNMSGSDIKKLEKLV